ncbi:hypothetical protein [Brevibacillus sp. DP1.3A]|uniref:hypothetical protein n=1 Tax=Brevibacillus sp. DP1.3A TaxID=2738867 RepID=UPI00351CCEDA|nr:hypothetical protein HP399_021955 [Brevibacillus sp. DP1.3A]
MSSIPFRSIASFIDWNHHAKKEEPNGVTITPNGTRVYVANQFDDTVFVITTTNNQVIATIKNRRISVNPSSMVFSFFSLKSLASF